MADEAATETTAEDVPVFEMLAEWLINTYNVTYHPAGSHMDVTFMDGCSIHVHTPPNLTPETTFPFLIQAHVYKHSKSIAMYSADLLESTAEEIKPVVGSEVADAPAPKKDDPNDYLGFATNGDRG